MTDVSVGYEGMQSGASQLQQGQEKLTEQLQSLRSMIDGLVGSEFRTQLASPRFQESYEQWNTGAQQMLEGLQGMATFLNQAVGGSRVGQQPAAGGQRPGLTGLTQRSSSHDFVVVGC